MRVVFDLYRFFSGEKVSSLRLLLYVLLGLVLSGSFVPGLFAMDLLFVLGGVLFASALNDYYDFRLLGEHNVVGSLVAGAGDARSAALLPVLLPLLLPVSLSLPMLRAGASKGSMLMLSSSFVLSVLYCAPPARLKGRKVLGILAPPLGIYLLFLQAVCLVGPPGTNSLLACASVFLFSWHVDFLHLADDSRSANEIERIPWDGAMAAARAVCVLGILLSAGLLPFGTFGLVPLFCWTARAVVVWNISPEQLKTERRNVLSRIYCIEEFAAYTVLAFLEDFLLYVEPTHLLM